MRKTFSVNLCYAVFLLLLSAILLCCNKSDGAGQPADNFTWTHKGVTHTTSINFAYLTTSGLGNPPFTILAGFPRAISFERRIQFYLTSFNTGAYTISGSPGAPNRLTYIDDMGDVLNGISGTLNITANTNNKLSGNFSTTVTDASSVNSQLTGSFTDITITP